MDSPSTALPRTKSLPFPRTRSPQAGFTFCPIVSRSPTCQPPSNPVVASRPAAPHPSPGRHPATPSPSHRIRVDDATPIMGTPDCGNHPSPRDACLPRQSIVGAALTRPIERGLAPPFTPNHISQLRHSDPKRPVTCANLHQIRPKRAQLARAAAKSVLRCAVPAFATRPSPARPGYPAWMEATTTRGHSRRALTEREESIAGFWGAMGRARIPAQRPFGTG
jgi:hypothetical protein